MIVDFSGFDFPGSGLPGSPGGGNFLEQILGDLLQLIGRASPSGSGHLELARSLAQGVATSGEPEGNVDPGERIELEELARIAELHVGEVTGMAATPTGAALEIKTLTPGAWAAQTVADWSYLLEALSETLPPGSSEISAGDGTAAGPGSSDETDPAGSSVMHLPLEDEPLESADMLKRWMATIGPMFAALQLGSAVGHLARNTIGQYEVTVPRDDSGRVLVVPGAIRDFADAWSLPVADVRMWVCIRDMTIHTVLSRPHVQARFKRLLQALAGSVAEGALGAIERLGDLDMSDPQSFQQLLEDPEALMDIKPSPARRRAAEELGALQAVLLGYTDHVLDLVGVRLLGGRSTIGEAWRRRQMEGDSSSRALELLLGIDSSPAQADRGRAFVDGVLERSGDGGLARLWAGAKLLPTPAEVEAPGLWLERIEIDDGEEDALS